MLYHTIRTKNGLSLCGVWLLEKLYQVYLNCAEVVISTTFPAYHCVMSTQLLLECAVARYQSVHASPDKADKQKVKDVYGTDRAKARNDHGPEPIQPILNYMNQKVLSSLRDPGSDNGRMRETMRFRMV